MKQTPNIAPDVNSSSQQSVTKTSRVWLTRTLSTDCIRHQEDFWTTAQIGQLLMLKHGRETSHKYYHTRNRQHATCPAQLNTKYDALIVYHTHVILRLVSIVSPAHWITSTKAKNVSRRPYRVETSEFVDEITIKWEFDWILRMTEGSRAITLTASSPTLDISISISRIASFEVEICQAGFARTRPRKKNVLSWIAYTHHNKACNK